MIQVPPTVAVESRPPHTRCRGFAGVINTLKTLQLSHNALNGKIPPGMFAVSLCGGVPRSGVAISPRLLAVFGDMPALVVLDLSWNQVGVRCEADLVAQCCSRVCGCLMLSCLAVSPRTW